MMLMGSVVASNAAFPVNVAASNGLTIRRVAIVSGASPSGNAIRVVLDELPVTVRESGLRVVVRATVLDPLSNSTVYPACYDEWGPATLRGASSTFDIPLPMSISYFLAPISMTVEASAL